jgi:hypothetical protein
MALRNHLEEDIRVAINQPDLSLPMLIDQISNMTAYRLTSSFVPLEQLQMALDHPGLFYCAGPKYWLETITDGVHMTTESSQRLDACTPVRQVRFLRANPGCQHTARQPFVMDASLLSRSTRRHHRSSSIPPTLAIRYERNPLD